MFDYDITTITNHRAFSKPLGQDPERICMEIHANLRVFAALLALHPWPAPFPWPLSISMRPLSVQQIAVCGRSIAALGRSDLSSFRNPARPIVVNAAKELEFAPLDRLALPTSAAATPRGDCHASTKIAPLVSLHPPRDLARMACNLCLQ